MSYSSISVTGPLEGPAFDVEFDEPTGILAANACESKANETRIVLVNNNVFFPSQSMAEAEDESVKWVKIPEMSSFVLAMELMARKNFENDLDPRPCYIV